jgi:multimeric flavodoxin WrbA
MKIAILNGSPQGKNGNCHKFFLRYLKKRFDAKKINLEIIFLNKKYSLTKFKNVDAFIIITGTYWDSWGSPLQKFLEEMTPYEGSSLWLGKPVMPIVLEHTVGGKGVLSRLMGVLNTLGAFVPPMGGMVYSLAETQRKIKSSQSSDFWSSDDLEVMIHNFLCAIEIGGKAKFKTWVVDKKNPRKIWVR